MDHDLYLIYEPMASALGIGLEVLKPKGNMVVDIGGGTTEIAVITLGGIAESSSIHVAGNEITTDIIDYLGHPAEAAITYSEIARCIDKTICKIENEIMKVLQKTPPELYMKGTI